ncbi:hypothetical protein LS684_20815 (plasmid) [Cytobacillus spongiae]|uniref:hypothetical protein n=1 Tax=Cytobacillus spongiae TaxID=2901381 RepID=UPI001CD2E789|nr:hypothetical protein [Cytobacillus spongiae]MCA1062479.1 hypothetical protein [Rossellomorea aquimaris]UII58072.1 hypothetical protein LS684_20815 [Cytobacillus spongiae]WJV28829.1 hypothetical protein QTG56_17620 [Rossellomorea sp. AcN35-11]
MSDVNEPCEGKELPLLPRNLQTSEELIDWVLSVLSSHQLSDEDLLSWWNEEIQFAVS